MRCHQNAPASPYHSCPQITSLAKNPRAHPLQSLVPNLQLSAVLPARIPSRTLHHPVNPLYPIILLSYPFSTPPPPPPSPILLLFSPFPPPPPVTSHLMFSKPSHIHHRFPKDQRGQSSC